MTAFSVNTSKRRVQDIGLSDRQQAKSLTEVQGDCSRPVELFLRGAPDKLLVAHGIEREGNAVQWMLARCRSCPECLAHRARLWTARAIDELRANNRTWFGTLTFAPHARFRAKLIAEHKVSTARREAWCELSAEEQFQAIQREVGPDVSLWLKRVRKETGATLRYLLVCEAHKDGFPHYHLLLHETVGKATKSVLEKQWRLGFSHWRLVDREDVSAVTYCCKYLTKSALTRVRASKDYGQPVAIARLMTERLMGATRELEKALASGAPRLSPSEKGISPTVWG